MTMPPVVASATIVHLREAGGPERLPDPSRQWGCDWWRWTVGIDAPVTEREHIDRVIYTLHPALPRSHRVVRHGVAPANGFGPAFCITVEAWGWTRVTALVILRDGRSILLDNDNALDLRHTVTLPGQDGESSPVAIPRLDDLPAPGDGQAHLALAQRYEQLGAFAFAREHLSGLIPDLARAVGLPVTGDLVPAIGADLRALAVRLLARCTARDASLTAARRLTMALAILGEGEVAGPPPEADSETLNLAAGLHVRRWMIDGQREHLERARNISRVVWNRAGTADAPTQEALVRAGNDLAWTLERLLVYEVRGIDQATIPAQPRESESLRRAVIVAAEASVVQRGDRWPLLYALAETSFGLGDYAHAEQWLRRALACDDAAPWRREAAGDRLRALLDTQRHLTRRGFLDRDLPRAQQVLALLDPALAGGGRFAGARIGLALSGGGLRAALFHLGVLARLAELDLLEELDTISCVSGGSILGARYYLGLKRLLEATTDDTITRQDYIDLVGRTISDFLAAVQGNLRTRIFCDPWLTLRMWMRADFSRTERLAELYEERVYAPGPDAGSTRPLHLDDLFIQPRVGGTDGQPALAETFHPRRDNRGRVHKVPTLVLNASTLNTGHLWQFTASSMGEPADSGRGDADSNERLCRFHFGEAPPSYRRFRLGRAVAASACVPGLFPPVDLPDLYPDRTVRLVDGGVNDNQGIRSLLDEECRTILVSDASGQMNAESVPGRFFWQTLPRANAMLQTRIREAEYENLETLCRAGLVERRVLLHLRKGLQPAAIAWIGADRQPAAMPTPADTPYGIPTAIQELLAGLRTDLDTFSDTEAYALMLSGYRMAEWTCARDLGRAGDPAGQDRVVWPFLALEPALHAAPDSAEAMRLRRLLKGGAHQGFKVWFLSPLSWRIAGVAVPAGLALLVWILIGSAWSLLILAMLLYGSFGVALALTWQRHRSPESATPSTAAGDASALAREHELWARRPFIACLHRARQAAGIAAGATGGFVVGAMSWAFSWLYLLMFEPLFKRAGAWPVPSDLRPAKPLEPGRHDQHG